MVISNEVFGGVSLLVGVISFFIYFYFIFKGKTKPHFFSWFSWGLLTAIAYFAQVVDNGGAGSWVTGFTALVSFIIAIVALMRGSRDISKSDWYAFVVSLFAIPLWFVLETPLYSVLLVTGIDIVAFFPTIRKSYSKPHEESVLFYFLSGLKYSLALIALENWSIITAIYPLSLVVMDVFFITLLFFRRRKIFSVFQES